ncbi:MULTISPECIES: phage protein Gp27 family protein [Serratia]|uniref:phage protein Gp27 family protein n=1 Tax=Serratia TaxID=613 RepID=UPI000660B887|nr:phage protein Gp27 family protein [Serratia sp. 506_PEND]
MDKPTRGRVKKADMLPDAIRKPLLDMLREKRLTQVQIRDEINRLIADAGLPDEAKLSAAGISRLAAENEAIARDLRELREQTKAMVAELGDKPTGETSALILELARSMLFKKIRAAASSVEDDNDIDIDFIKNAMLAIQRLESAAERSLKREKEIRAAFAEEAASAVTEELRGVDGMSEQLESRIRSILIGKA